MKKIALILVVLLVAGCASTRHQPSREEWQQFTSREYNDVTPGQVLDAAERVLMLSDGNDCRISWGNGGLHAERFYSVFLVITAVQGNFIWDIKAEKTESGVITTAIVESRIGGMLQPTRTMTINTAGTYELFFSRLDYMLNKSDKWLSCADADKAIDGDTSALCFATDDNMPVAVAIAK